MTTCLTMTAVTALFNFYCTTVTHLLCNAPLLPLFCPLFREYSPSYPLSASHRLWLQWPMIYNS